MAQKMDWFSHQTREDKAIQEHRGKMGVILFRKKAERRGLCSGSIVNVEGSNLFPKSVNKIKLCLLTSDIHFPEGNIGVEDYFFEYWSSDLAVKQLSLGDVAQSNGVYRPTPGLALIPVCLTTAERLRTFVKSSVLDKRRTFPTRYHYEDVESENRNKEKLCFIMGSYEFKKGSLTMERFTLITKRDDQGKLRNELQDVNGSTFQSYDQIRNAWAHLYPRGAVILEDDGPQATCVGILNFSEEGLISPVYFTTETLTGNVQLYYPTDVKVKEEAVSESPDGRMEPTTSQIEIDSPIHSQDVPSSTVVESQSSSLYEEVRDENTKLKQPSEHDEEMISVLKKDLTELRRDITKTEQQNEELRAENEYLRSINEELSTKNEELSTKNKELCKALDAKSKELREDDSELCTENNLLKTNNDKLREDNRKLRAENNELRKEWNEEGDYLREVNEELRTLNNQLKAKNKELLAKNEELSASLKKVPDQLKELLNQQNRAVFRDDASSIKDSNDEKVEGPSGTSANSSRGDSNGSHKDVEPFLDPSIEGACELE